MHRTDGPSGQSYFHNGDFSGPVRIDAATAQSEEEAEKKSGVVVIPSDGKYGDVEVFIPGKDILHLAAEYIRNRKVSAIEQMTTAQLLSEKG